MANKQDYENKAMTTPPAGGAERRGRPGEVPPDPGRPAPAPEPAEADDPATGTPPVRPLDPLPEPTPSPTPTAVPAAPR